MEAKLLSRSFQSGIWQRRRRHKFTTARPSSVQIRSFVQEKMSVAELKAKGNSAFAAKDYNNAIQHYSEAIAAAKGPEDAVHVLYSNRSACYSGLKKWDEALDDANETIKANPQFAKGYGRKGGALHGARRFDEAIEAYEEGLKFAPADAALKKGLDDVRRAQESGGAAGGGIGDMFKDPQMLAKLAANPKTAPLLADKEFMEKLKTIQADPNQAMNAFQDPRMIQVMGVLMGIDLQAFERPEGSKDLPEDLEEHRENIERQTGGASSSSQTRDESSTKPASTPAASKASQTAASTSQSNEVEDEAMDETEDGVKADKSAGDAEKAKANALYLKRQFDEAIPHYQKAWELNPKDITYLSNLAACYFEKGDYQECIKQCEKAVEEGRAMRADYKLVAKAFGRIGSAYEKQDNLAKAIQFYEKSLTEHRTPDILTKLRTAEKSLKERERLAYIDPAKADEERNRGNELYKAGDFAGSVQAYTESIKRNPQDPRGYTNRASAYTKLVALPEALKDCEEAIKLDDKFTKGYIRKSNVLYSMKDHTKALEAIQLAAEIDREHHNSASAREIQQQTEKCMQALYAQRSTETDEETLQRAMRDPEVAKIMQDPVMQSILQQAQSDPRALQSHMQNAQVRAKIEKLIAAGIIRTR
jgi:stress-induced-phosphoprotein 1